MNRQSGTSFIEIVIAAAIMTIVILMIYLLFFATDKAAQTETELRDAQFRLQTEMDALTQEVRDSSQPLIRTVSFTDPQMPTPAQTLIVFPSARDATNTYHVANAQSVWQKLVVYAPYYDATLKMGELRRYEVTPIDAAFTDAAQSPTITINATTITLQGTSVARNGGKRVLANLDHIRIAPNGTNTNEFEIALKGGAPLLRQVNLLSGAKGRN